MLITWSARLVLGDHSSTRHAENFSDYYLAKLDSTNNIQTIMSRCITPSLVFKRCLHNKANSSILEIVGGAGGSEAMLFANDMFGVYSNYLTQMRWPYQIVELDNSDLGGIRSAKMVIEGSGSFEGLIQEAGVHRVQRVPKTEKSGRMHTSTITVSVIPKSVIDIKIREKDIEVQTKRSTGPGGQHVNKTESAVRLVHRPSGISAESQESKFQIENRKIAMRKLLERIQAAEMEKVTSQLTNMKKLQIGNADRNEKIRTYNFPQDRITDHRIGKTYHNLRGLFSGDTKVLEKMIEDFRAFYK